MATTLEEIREGHGKSPGQLDRIFRRMTDEECPFREARLQHGARLGARISKYECANSDPSFGTQVRYGIVSDTWSGVIHIVSLLYAQMRDAVGPNNDRMKEIENAKSVLRKLRALIGEAERMIQEFDKKDSEFVAQLASEQDVEVFSNVAKRRSHRALIIRPLLDAYRNG